MTNHLLEMMIMSIGNITVFVLGYAVGYLLGRDR